MSDEDKTKGQLLCELAKVRRHIADIEELKAEHKRIEKIMRMAVDMANEEKSKTEAIIAAIGDGISILDTDFKVLFQNQGHMDLIGDRKGEYCYRAYANRSGVCPGCPVARTYEDGEIHTLEKSVPKETGTMHIEIKASPLRDSSGKIIAGIEAVRDITARKQAEEALLSAESKFRTLVEQSLIGIYIIQGDMLSYVNPKLAEIFGYTQDEMMSGKKVLDLVSKEDRGLVANNIRKRLGGEIQSIHYTFKGKKKDGTLIDIEAHGTITSYEGEPAIIGTLLDISIRREMEAELQKSHKLESLSVLAGELAHQFNNILTALTGNVILAKMYAKPGSEVADILTEAEKASLKAEELTRQLLTFSKGGAPLTRTISLRKIIAGLAEFVPRGSAISCEPSLSDNLWPVAADEGQIQQAIKNLIINAQQAMPGGGVIRITAENMIADSVSIPSLRKGQYVKMTIADQGTGISKEHMEKIFEPFFTTKDQGSGLGLASTFSIIKNHGGEITVSSEEGAGTIFTVYLPAVSGETPEEAGEGKVYLTSNQKILVMDDEDMIRNVIDRMLAQCGCTASFARDGNEMIKLYRQSMESGKPYDAVIIDLIIAGGMGGKEAIEKLLELDPNAKAIVSSGYSDDTVLSNFRKFGFKGALAKPYSISELGKALHEVIFGPS